MSRKRGTNIQLCCTSFRISTYQYSRKSQDPKTPLYLFNLCMQIPLPISFSPFLSSISHLMHARIPPDPELAPAPIDLHAPHNSPDPDPERETFPPDPGSDPAHPPFLFPLLLIPEIDIRGRRRARKCRHPLPPTKGSAALQHPPKIRIHAGPKPHTEHPKSDKGPPGGRDA